MARMCPPPPVAPGPFPSLLTGGEGLGCTMRGSPAPGWTPPLRVNSALVKVSPLLRLFFPLNPTGKTGNLVGRRPGVWGELGTLGLCDLVPPTPPLSSDARTGSPVPQHQGLLKSSGSHGAPAHPSILQGGWAPSSAWQGALRLLPAQWSERAPDAR